MGNREKIKIKSRSEKKVILLRSVLFWANKYFFHVIFRDKNPMLIKLIVSHKKEKRIAFFDIFFIVLSEQYN